MTMIMIDKATLERAIDTLRLKYSDQIYDGLGSVQAYAFEDDVEALRELLVQPQTQPVAVQQEPVAWAYTTNGLHTNFTGIEPPDDAYDDGSLMALYTSPQAAQPPSPSHIQDGIANHIEDVFQPEKVWTVLQTAAYIRSIEIHSITKGNT